MKQNTRVVVREANLYYEMVSVGTPDVLYWAIRKAKPNEFGGHDVKHNGQEKYIRFCWKLYA